MIPAVRWPSTPGHGQEFRPAKGAVRSNWFEGDLHQGISSGRQGQEPLLPLPPPQASRQTIVTRQEAERCLSGVIRGAGAQGDRHTEAHCSGACHSRRLFALTSARTALHAGFP